MIKKIIFCCFVIFFPSVAVADWLGAVVHVRTTAPHAPTSGSGFIYSHDTHNTYVLTNRHVVGRGSGVIVSTSDRSEVSRGSVVFTATSCDLAAIVCDPLTPAPIPLAQSLPSIGAHVYVAGFGGNRAVLSRWAARFVGPNTRGDILQSTQLIPGDSGGVVCDTNGRLIGLNWGTDGNVGLAVPCLTISAALRAHNSRCTPPGRQPPTHHRRPDEGYIAEITEPPPKTATPPIEELAEAVAELIQTQTEKPAAIDIDALTTRIIERLPPVVMEIHDRDNVQKITKRLGEPIKIAVSQQR